MLRVSASLGLLLALTFPGITCASPAAQDTDDFLKIYRELVETDTSLSGGGCTQTVAAIARRLRDAGYSHDEIFEIAPPSFPDQGNLVAVLPGRKRAAPALLLLAHLDVVEARRAEWSRDPFKLVEEGGYFYGRGTADDKARAAVWVDALINFRRRGRRFDRDVKMMLTCGEETAWHFDGAEYLLQHHPRLVDAGLGLNEGAHGLLDDAGTPVALHVQVGEKSTRNVVLRALSPGGHASKPGPDNAIVRLSAAVARVAEHRFPVRLLPSARAHLAGMGPLVGGELGEAMLALARDDADSAAADYVSRFPEYNAMIRDTCAVTKIDGGHAINALPQTAQATFNCRLLPGSDAGELVRTIEEIVSDTRVIVTPLQSRALERVAAPPVTEALLRPIRRAASPIWAGIPVVPILVVGGTDGIFLNAAGIPTYGVSGMFRDPDGNGIHGLNERLRVSSLLNGRRFLNSLIQILADGREVDELQALYARSRQPGDSR